ncbi:hypothetical protein [Micromonospora sp. NBC_01796]|uniref:hypothetical protein n=1 Tax=Micromonospora sp. NBC_01796 TaxID=2975987 RepID=UPI002DDB8DAB|nr:hypothetical protein [Micromonospora sp. NBC_01796]WSA86725.1 hypothetical protein OIE47_03620 [Micromonospora sp. NBC_01796]
MTGPEDDTRRTPAPQRFGGFAAGLARLSEVLVLGLLTLVAALPLVTAYVAVTAAVTVLRDRADDGAGVTVRGYLRALRATAGSGWWPYLVPVALAAVLTLDAAAVGAGLPGGRIIGPALLLATALLAATALRAAVAWHPHTGWPAAAASAVDRTRSDPTGTALLLLALIAVALTASMGPILWPLLPGLPALAAVAVDRRRPTGTLATTARTGTD